MISRKEFKEFVESSQKITEFFDNCYKIGIDIHDKVRDNIGHIEYFLIKENFGEDGYGWFTWWMYDLPSLKKSNPNDNHAFESDGTPIKLDTVDDLYDFLLENYSNKNGENKCNS